MKVVDADTHVAEPPDLWTARMPAKYHDALPHVERIASSGMTHWVVGDTVLWPVGYFNVSGWTEYVPSVPGEFDMLDPAGSDAKLRLARMDEFGIDVQLLYPNLVGFQGELIRNLGPELSIEAVRVYNDFLTEWASADPSRLIPIAMLPYWDREASVKEMQRAIGMGHRGVLFANKFERIGLPSFTDSYWDPIYASAQELDVPINFHIGFSLPEFEDALTEASLAEKRARSEAYRTEKALTGALILQSQAATLGALVTSGICDRFPDLNLVSVETGFGHIPMYFEALDWNWGTYGVKTDLLPSEYFRRQCYGTFWFERVSLRLLDLYPDNFMFSTDFPHPTSLTPGPCSPADVPSSHLDEAFGSIDPVLAEKAVSGNARRLYKIA